MSNNDEPSITTSPSIDILMDVDFVGHHESAMVPEHASLFCLAFYLHLGFEDEQHRVEQINDLFFASQNPASDQEMMGALQEDKLAFECYLKAIEALANQEIEEHVSDPNFHLLAEENKPENEEVYTISFLVWTEKQGNTIPDHIMNDVKFLMERYPISKHYRDTMKRDFPILTNEEFQRLTKEPLWTLANAIMYLTGHSSLKDEQAIIDFINGKNLTKTIIEYAKDASIAKDLMLYGNVDNEHEKDWLLNTKVKPSELIDWAKTLEMDFPNLLIDNNQPVETGLHTKERQTLLKMLIGMAIDGYGFDPNASRSPLPKELEGNLDKLGLSVSDDTIRKWLKEAAEHLPQNNEPD